MCLTRCGTVVLVRISSPSIFDNSSILLSFSELLSLSMSSSIVVGGSIMSGDMKISSSILLSTSKTSSISFALKIDCHSDEYQLASCLAFDASSVAAIVVKKQSSTIIS